MDKHEQYKKFLNSLADEQVALVDAAQARVEDAQKMLDKEISNKKYLLELLGYSSIEPIETAQTVKTTQDGHIDLSSIKVDGKARGGLRADIEKLLPRFGDQQFNVAQIEAILASEGTPVEGKTPRSKISLVLGRLEKDNQIKCVVEGGGNVPKEYVALNNTQVAAVEQDVKEVQAKRAGKDTNQSATQKLITKTMADINKVNATDMILENMKN